jgi:hypothetical protein
LREVLHRSPREFGCDTSLWTLEMAAQAGFEEGLTRRRRSRGGDYPDRPGAPPRSALAAGQTLDHLPRSPVRKKKEGATD